MFPEDEVAPAIPTTTIRWVCADCGSDDPRTVRLDQTRPSVDDRYGIGYCDSCTPGRRTVRGIKRQAVTLVRSDVFDRTDWKHQRQLADDANLLRRYRAGHLLTKDDMDRVRQIVARLG